MLTVGSILPEFSLKAVDASSTPSSFSTIGKQDLAGKWAVLFFWPKDFTFVCPTEIVAFNDLLEEFEDRDAKLVGASTDSEFVHLAWRQSREDLSAVNFPWLADIKKDLARELGILDEAEGVALRATFIIDPNGIIRYASANDLSVGRNPKEVLRVLDALQTDELCPCNWTKGQETIKVGNGE